MPRYTGSSFLPIFVPSSSSALAPAMALALVLLLALTASGCSIRGYALRATADAVSRSGNGGGGYGEDDDPELVRLAAPFGLKTMEQLLSAVPDHRELPVALASGFTQYGYAFVQQDAERLEDKDLARAQAGFLRARRLYLRARDYALFGLARRHGGMNPDLHKILRFGKQQERDAALQKTDKDDVPLLYWGAASWALAVSTAKDNPDLIGDLPVVEAMMARALALDEAFDEGAIHEFYVTYDATRSKEQGGGPERARQHLARAMQLNHNHRVGPLLAYAEGVLVQQQNKEEFKKMLQQVLAVNIYAEEEGFRKERLANAVNQARARWLLSRLDDLFA